MSKDNIIKKETLSDKAYKYLRKQIVSGKIKGGDLITEKSIGEILNMSRTPVKRALTRLEQEGYVKSVDGVGTIVSKLSLSDLTDIYEVRIELEKLALKSSINYIPYTQINRLERELMLLISNKSNGINSSDYFLYSLDEEFHTMIINNSLNNYVKEIYLNIKNQIDRYQHEAYTLTDTAIESTEYHLIILGFIKEKNLEKALESLEDHLKWSYKVMVEALTKLFN